LRTVNQGLVIEELLKKKGGINVNGFQDGKRNNEFWIRLDDLNKDYVELIKKFKALEKDKVNLQKIIDDLQSTNQVLEGDFKLLFK
jgi:hypothetical protein